MAIHDGKMADGTRVRNPEVNDGNPHRAFFGARRQLRLEMNLFFLWFNI